MKRLFSYAMLCAFISILVSCQNELTETSELDKNIPDLEVLTRMGFDTQNAYEIPHGYIVEGDIIIAHEHIEEFKSTPETRQRYYGIDHIVGHYGRDQISVTNNDPYYHSSLGEAITRACSIWNNIEGTSIRFKYIYNGTAPFLWKEVEVKKHWGWEDWMPDYPYRNKIVAIATIPLDYKTRPLYINNQAIDGLSESKKTWAMVHALGHSIGLAHTDHPGGESSIWSDSTEMYKSIQIDGTPTSEYASVMNHNNYEVKDFNGLSPGDILAVRKLYPGIVDMDLEVNPIIYIGKVYEITAKIDDPTNRCPFPWVNFRFEGNEPEIISRTDTSVIVKFEMSGSCRVIANINNSTPNVVTSKYVWVDDRTPDLIQSPTGKIRYGMEYIFTFTHPDVSSPQCEFELTEDIWNHDAVVRRINNNSIGITFNKPGRYNITVRETGTDYVETFSYPVYYYIVQLMTFTPPTGRTRMAHVQLCGDNLNLPIHTVYGEMKIKIQKRSFSKERGFGDIGDPSYIVLTDGDSGFLENLGETTWGHIRLTDYEEYYECTVEEWK